MPRRPRTSPTDHYYHVLNRAAERVSLFARRREYRDFLEILKRGLAKHPIPLIAYCLMDNHWHLVLGPTGSKRLSDLLHWVTTTHAVRVRRQSKSVGVGPVYQSRFKSIPLVQASSLVRACRYVERNALTAGLVRRAQDWPWGSLADRLRPVPTMPLAGADFLGSRAWIELVNSISTQKELDSSPVPKTRKTVENRPVPKSRDDAEAPGGGEGGEQGVGVGGRGDQHEADAHVERAKHLRILKLPRALQPREHRRHAPAVAVK
jgi:putative transposase